MLLRVYFSPVAATVVLAAAISACSLPTANLTVVSTAVYEQGVLVDSIDSTAVLAGPYARNRIWHVFNNDCRRTNNESELEINMCVAMHRATSHSERCRALGYLIDAGMISFPRSRMDWMARGLARSPPDRVLYVTRIIATNNHRGRFLLELCRDETRMTRFLNRQQIQLE